MCKSFSTAVMQMLAITVNIACHTTSNKDTGLVQLKVYEIIFDYFKVIKLDHRCYFYHIDATDLHLIVSGRQQQRYLDNLDLKICHASESRCLFTRHN